MGKPKTKKGILKTFSFTPRVFERLEQVKKQGQNMTTYLEELVEADIASESQERRAIAP